MKSAPRFASLLPVIALLAAPPFACAANHKADRPPVITKITVVGNQKLSVGEIMDRVTVQVGDEFNPDELDRDVRRIKRLKGITDVIYTTKKVKRGVELTFEVVEEVAPTVQIEPEPAPKPEAKGTPTQAPSAPEQAPAEKTTAPEPPAKPKRKKPAKSAKPAPEQPTAPTVEPTESAPQEQIPIGSGSPGIAKVGVVDWGRISAEWKAAQAMEEENRRVQRMPTLFQRELQYRRLLISLTADEQDRAVELKSKDRLTNKEKAESDSLEKRAKERDQRFAELQSNTNRTDDEQSEFALLKETRDNSQRRLRELEAKYTAQIQDASNALRDKDRLAGMKAREVIAEVSQDLGLELVFRYEYLLYGGLDITQEVIDRLNEEVSLIPEPE